MKKSLFLKIMIAVLLLVLLAEFAGCTLLNLLVYTQSGAEYTVTFADFEGISFSAITAREGERIYKPEMDLVKEGYVLNWYLDQSYSLRFAFYKMTAGDKKLFGRWDKIDGLAFLKPFRPTSLLRAKN